MKKFTLLLLSLFISAALLAQVTNEGKPLSWKLLTQEKTLTTKVLPSFDLKALHAEDAINDLDKEGPWRFGFKHMVDYGFEDGIWNTLENGDRIWRIKFTSPGALTMNVIFDQFYMPKGAKLYLYNDARTDLLGAYTAIQNQESGSLGTWIVKGETLWIEYYEPEAVAHQGKLHFESITHGYRTAESEREKNLGDSGDCNHDVDCPIGADFEDHKNHNKKSVAKILTNGSDWCSGALINNTANDGKPYLLTANHCVTSQNPANWSFIFGWISPDPSCGTTTASTDGSTAMTISGAVTRANNAASDFCLVELNSEVPPAWDRVWAGWDRTDAIPGFVVGIHHPAGDIMKVCREDDSPTQVVFNGTTDEWEITAAGNGWEIGVTEGGSSGSPLFDPEGRIIGQLHRGGAACSGTVDNNDYDQYGRFATSWDTGTTDAVKLRPWLDPQGSNPNTLDSYPPQQVYAIDAQISVTIPAIACGVHEVNPYLTITNKGTTTLTSADISWDLNGGTSTNIAWTGSLVQNASEDITLGTMTLGSGSHDIHASVSNPNASVDENALNDSATASIAFSDFVTTQVHLDLLTDNYSNETSWEFRDASGTVLYSGGTYNGESEDNTHFLEDFDVTAGQCYTFEIFDSIGDGICCSYGNGSYELTTDDNTVIVAGASFGSSQATEISVTTSTGVDDFLGNNIRIFPNPSEGNVQIRMNSIEGSFTYSFSNTLGQKVKFGELQDMNTSLDVSNLNNGIYFIKIADSASQKYMVKKIIIQK